MGRKAKWPPTMSHHKPSGRARVRWKGRDYPMGPWDKVRDEPSEEAKQRYARFLERISRGESAQEPVRGTADLTVRDLVAEWWEREAPRYSERGRERAQFLGALAPLTALYGTTPAAEFGLEQLQSLRLSMGQGTWMPPDRRARVEARGKSPAWCAHVCNARVGRIRTVWRWAESQGYVPEGRWAHLCSLPPIRPNDARFRHTSERHASTEEVVELVASHALPPVAAMIRLQYWTGMRSGEVRIMRAGDVDTSAEEWLYRPEVHKTDYLGHTRVIVLGPHAREILAPWLAGKGAEDYLFQPVIRRSRPYYCPSSYAQAVRRAAADAGVEGFCPYQGRHATKARVLAAGGTLDDARALLGQKSIETTAGYSAAIDLEAARKAARKVG